MVQCSWDKLSATLVMYGHKFSAPDLSFIHQVYTVLLCIMKSYSACELWLCDTVHTIPDGIMKRAQKKPPKHHKKQEK